MTIQFNQCPYCKHIFYDSNKTEKEEQFEKYKHLSEHKEFKDKIDIVLKELPNIHKWISIKLDSKFNINRNTHQFVQILYNHKEIEYNFLLKKFDCYLNNYAQYIENLEKNIVTKKTLTDFFSFYSELEVMDSVYKVFNETPLMAKSVNSLNIDLISNKSKLLIEVKTPITTKKHLFEYIVDWKSQKQIKSFKEKEHYEDYCSLLIINSKYAYPEFGSIRGFKEFRTQNEIFWDCCITYNNFHHRGDIYFKKEPSDYIKRKVLIDLFNKLKN